MAYTSTAPRDLAYANPTPSKPRAGFVRRILDRIMAARLRQADQEIATYLADTGGKFTDEAEREIERRFLSTPTRW
jgi:hypothetical protein